MIFVILLVWILAWTPYVILHCWIMFFEPNSLSAEMAIAPSLFCKSSAAVNSLLYGVRYSFNVPQNFFQKRRKEAAVVDSWEIQSFEN